MTTKKTNYLRKHLTAYMLIAVLIVTSLFAGLGAMLSNKTSSASADSVDNMPTNIAGVFVDAYEVSFGEFEFDCSPPVGYDFVSFGLSAEGLIHDASLIVITDRGNNYYHARVDSDLAYFGFALFEVILKVTPLPTFPLPESPTKEGHTFSGWYLDEACTLSYDGRPIYAETLLYAGFTINTYSVVFNTYGGNRIPSISLKYKQRPTMPADPTKLEHKFRGWYFDSNFTAPYVDFEIKTNVTFFAKWEINTYTIIFHTNGASEIASVTADYNTIPTMPRRPTKEGHTFSGWYTDSGLTNAYIDSAITTNFNLYAKFEISKYTVTFNTGGGNVLETATYNWNTNITELPTPTRTGYNFSGWTHNGASFTSGVITSNMTLAATWEAIIYKVTFMVDGETYKTLDVPYGTILKDIAKEQNISIYNAFMSADGKSLSKDTKITGESTFSIVEMTNGEKFMEFCKTYWVVPLIVGLLLVGGIITLVIFIKKRQG